MNLLKSLASYDGPGDILCIYGSFFFFLSREEMQLLHFFLLDLLKLYSFTMIAQKHLVSLPQVYILSLLVL